MERRLEKSKSQLELALSQMQLHQEKKDYLKAQASKQEAEKLKAEITKLEAKDLKHRQKTDLTQIRAMHAEEMQKHTCRQEEELGEIKSEGEEVKEELLKKQKEEMKNL